MHVRDVIEALGDTRKVADVCGVGLSTVSMWKARASIPAEYWRALIKEAEKRRVKVVTYALLGQLHAKSECEPNSQRVQA